jgi:integrase
VDWFDRTTPGLALRVTPHGARTWYLFYRRGKTARRVKLGTWPALELGGARKLARNTRVRVETAGADPAHERRDAREAFTVGDLAKLYLEQYAMAHKRTWRDDYWRLERYILPAWNSRVVGDITRGDVHTLLDQIAADGKPIQANRVQALVSKLWNFAIDREHATVNPCYRMGKAAPEHVRVTVLDDDAIRALWRALDAAPNAASDALRVRLLTGQRGGEVHGMEWAEVDLKAGVWTIPAERAKNGQAHRVPLSKAVLDVLKARERARPKNQVRVFPGLYHQRDDLRDLAAVHGDAYRWHDLRRTVATRLAEMGILEKTIGRVLNHAERGVTATVYNQYQYDAEKRAALDAWAVALDAIVKAR